jgi:hypothetical protein
LFSGFPVVVNASAQGLQAFLICLLCL